MHVASFCRLLLTAIGVESRCACSLVPQAYCLYNRHQQPSSERVFSVLFSSQQESSLEDYIQLSVNIIVVHNYYIFVQFVGLSI